MAGNPGQNFFVPGGAPPAGAPAAWGQQNQQHPNAPMGGHNGARAGRYAPGQAPAGDRQDFDELNQAITNIIEGDISNSVAVQNPARTGALRVTANNRHAEPPATRAKHYHAKTIYTKNFTYITLYILSIIASLIYIAVRIYYIANGVLALQIPSNQPVVDTSTCGDAVGGRTGTNCNSEYCGNNPDECGTIQASELLIREGTGITVDGENNVIEPEDIDAIEFKGIKQLFEDFTYSYWWSIVVLAAEIGGFILVHLSQQMFIRQDTKFFEMAPERINQLREITTRKGPLQRINVMVCTYNEPMETVKSCVEYLLASEAPVYCEKIIYIGDDGAKKKFQCSEDKRVMCEEFHKRGYTNVIWVGDRKALPHQLNGKSSNINHMVLRKMYPDVKETSQVPFRDVLMVMDCDHLVEPEFFAKACAVMLDRDVAVCLIPQSFHNEVQPDCFDNTNYNFMFRLMPYYFGAGCCFVTGTNVMIRARAAFMACQFDDNPHAHETQNLPGATQKVIKEALGGDAHRQLFSEVLVAEDIDLGSRVHTLGFKSVFLAEVLAKGEVPRGARDIWKQRSRWAAAAHMYILTPTSVFWRKQKNMSYWQKSLYWIPMVLHWTLIWAEPIMFSMPIICLGFDICPYGIDLLLWVTHFIKLVTTFLISSYADTLELSRAAIYGQTMARVLFFVNVKAVLNTIMVYTGWKRPGAFKVTTKAGGAPTPAGGAAPAAVEAAPVKEEEVERDTGGPTVPKVLKGLKMHRVHGALSKVTETRKKCMPFEGTLDFWVLLGITLMNLIAVGVGFYKINDKQQLLSLRGCQSQNVQLIALVFAFIEATPGLLFIMYIFVQEKAEWVMKIWVPLLIGTVSILCILIEFRVGIQYLGQELGDFVDYTPEDPTVCGNIENPADRS